ncbi:MAG: hypothetical protein KatS3mg070_0218 [Meiothermus sp.]|uniref:hypothetical protein n=1 Tax=Meiothermus sp. TaxID=1955249 RepID=UPI0021DCCD46|nr:hypothetical protein [Meiothermus sp.]GIW26855.1 MAG: hypothetical protein KatS3mg070_0218 [Meiothermus sp.]
MKVKELSTDEAEMVIGGCNIYCRAWKFLSDAATVDWIREKLEEMSKTGGSSEPTPVLYDQSSGWYDKPKSNQPSISEVTGGGGRLVVIADR